MPQKALYSNLALNPIKPEKTNYKSQITNKNQWPKTQIQNKKSDFGDLVSVIEISNFEFIWNLSFVIWDLIGCFLQQEDL